MADVTDQYRCQWVAIGIAVVGQHTKCWHNENVALINTIGIIHRHWGIVGRLSICCVEMFVLGQNRVVGKSIRQCHRIEITIFVHLRNVLCPAHFIEYICRNSARDVGGNGVELSVKRVYRWWGEISDSQSTRPSLPGPIELKNMIDV